MESKDSRESHLEQEAKVLIRLAQLLQMPRSPKDKKTVLELMASRKTDREKLKILESLSLKTQTISIVPHGGTAPNEEISALSSEDLPPQTPADSLVRFVETLDSNRAKPGVLRIQGRWKFIKRDFLPSGFWRFLFCERGRILDFGHRTAVISKGRWLWSLMVKPEVFTQLRDHLQKEWAHGLRKVLKGLLERSWKYLTRTEYNLMAVMDRLCAQIEEIPFESFNPTDSRLFERLASVVPLFFVFYSRADYLELLLFALEKALAKDPHQDAVRSISQTLVKKILTANASRPSLYHVIEGLAMIRWKRNINLMELLDTTHGPYLCHDEFDCTAPVQELIDKTVKDSVQKLNSLRESLTQVRLLRGFLPLLSDGTVDLSDWEKVYDGGLQGQGGKWIQDQENYFLFGASLAEVFSSIFEGFLCGQCLFADEKKRKIFTSEIFGPDMEKFQILIPRLRKTGFALPGFSLNRFRNLRTQGGKTTSLEGEGLAFLQELGKRFVHMAEKLIAILSSRLPWEEGIEYPPIPSLILSGRKAHLPGEGYLVAENLILGGRTGLELLNWITSLCLRAGVIFFDDRVMGLSRSQNHLVEEIKKRMDYLERVADSNLWEMEKKLGTG